MDAQDAASVGLDRRVQTLDENKFKGETDAFQKTLLDSLEQQKLRFQSNLLDAEDHKKKYPSWTRPNQGFILPLRHGRSKKL